MPKACYWCGKVILPNNRSTTIRINGGEPRHFHTSSAPLGKDCSNEYLQKMAEEARAQTRLRLQANTH